MDTAAELTNAVAALVAADAAAERLVDALPTGVVVIDGFGTVRYANRHVRDAFGWTREDAVGRSMLDVVAPDDVVQAVTALDEGPDYFGHVLGPMRMRFVDRHGAVGFTEYWARELEDRTGYVLVTPYGSVIDAIGDAVQAIATGQPVENAVELIVSGFGAYPMTGAACLLRVVDDELVPMTPWPFDGRIVSVPDAPWRQAARTARPVDVNEPGELPDEVAAGIPPSFTGSLWCRPVIGRRGEVSAVIVVFRPLSRPPTANQSHRMEQLVNVAALAFDQLEYRHTLERAAFTDPLTGVATRARLRQELDDGLAWSSVVYLDLDGFKEINDRHGHGAGDHVLAEIGARLRAVVRAEDLIVRIGGDEFVLVLRDTAAGDASRVAERLIDNVQRTIVVDGATGLASVSVGASVGVCNRVDDLPFDEATRLADEALGSAKQLGKGRCVVAQP